MKIYKSEIKKLIKEVLNEQKLNELTTWDDIGINSMSAKRYKMNWKNYSPILTGWTVKDNKTGKIYNIKSTDEKYVHVNNHEDIPVGDGFVYSNDFTLISPSGKELDLRER